MLNQEQIDVLKIMEDNTHVLFNSEFVDRFWRVRLHLIVRRRIIPSSQQGDSL